MMIALAFIISSLSHINCHRMQSWHAYARLPQASLFQQPFFGRCNDPRIQYSPNFEIYREYIPQTNIPSSMLSSRTIQSSIAPPYSISDTACIFDGYSSRLSQTTSSNGPYMMSQKMSELLSTVPNTAPLTSKIPQYLESTTYSSSPTYQLVPNSPQINQAQAQVSSIPSPSTPTFSSSSNSAAPSQTPSPIISRSRKSPRCIIPSLLTDTIPLPYPYNDPYMNMCDLPEPELKSVGCLELTITPYGTISETPLPDPSIPLPRSPFLPAASPVSALAPPSSPLLPAACPAASSSNFLRKVPIPPPFI